ncbi:MAG: hypothetical protein HXY34_05995 [Candidatus Thorarchaeota archaeon]|nr:hypothetical protein [Candidatus Thorarchaeota archaeon]
MALGYICGRTTARMTALSTSVRLGMVALLSVCVAGGVPLGFSLMTTVTDSSWITSLVTTAFGVFYGLIGHWKPSEPRPVRARVVYEPEDDEDFDRAIEHALGSDTRKTRERD